VNTTTTHVLGIDIGGSGIKGAIIDIQTGTLTVERHRLTTPQPPTPQAVIETTAQVIAHFDWHGPVGCGFPAVVKDGIVHTASNIAPEWVGEHGQDMLAEATGCPVWFLNDADAAGIAEVTFGAGRGVRGLVLITTIGTGIGTSLFIDGRLVPNTELGHIEINGKEAEKWASDGVRKKKDLSWKEWAERLNMYLQTMENLLWPDLIIIGGGVSKKTEKYFQYLDLKTRLVPAQLLNEAGMIGAALAAHAALQPA
jgi:polyphosphate glucokinase